MKDRYYIDDRGSVIAVRDSTKDKRGERGLYKGMSGVVEMWVGDLSPCKAQAVSGEIKQEAKALCAKLNAEYNGSEGHSKKERAYLEACGYLKSVPRPDGEPGSICDECEMCGEPDGCNWRSDQRYCIKTAIDIIEKHSGESISQEYILLARNGVATRVPLEEIAKEPERSE